MVRGLALSVACCLSMTGGLVATTAAAHADICGGRTGNPIHTKAWLGFKVDKRGHWLKGKLIQLDLAKKDSTGHIRGACHVDMAEAARAYFCAGGTGYPMHPKAWIGFKVDKNGHWL